MSRQRLPAAPADRAELLAALAVDVDPGLLDLALTHRSYAYESGGRPDNERLEFLGDSVLGLVVTDALYHQHPGLAEGQLAPLRAGVVNSRALAVAARALHLGDHLLLGRGELMTGGRDKSSLLADALEALLGAVYLSAGGLEAARTLILRIFATALADAGTGRAGMDWKTALQEIAAARARGPVTYQVSEDGPEHAKSFVAVALVGGVALGQGGGPAKKLAEQAAAEVAHAALLDPQRAPAAEPGAPAR